MVQDFPNMKKPIISNFPINTWAPFETQIVAQMVRLVRGNEE